MPITVPAAVCDKVCELVIRREKVVRTISNNIRIKYLYPNIQKIVIPEDIDNV